MDTATSFAEAELLPNWLEDLEPSIGKPPRRDRSEQGRGDPVEGPQAQTEGPAEETLGGLRILIVDDDEGCRRGIAAVLSDQGHEILTAARGWEALQEARRLRQARMSLDLSILDYNMPDMTGIETFRRLVLEVPGLPAIFVSGESSATLEEEIRLVGGRALLRKPIDVVRVRRVVQCFAAGGGFMVT